MNRDRRTYSPIERLGLRALLKTLERGEKRAAERQEQGLKHYINVMGSGVWVDITEIKRKALAAAAKVVRQQLVQGPEQGENSP